MGTRDKLLRSLKTNFLEHLTLASIQNLFDNWAIPVVFFLLLKSSLLQRCKSDSLLLTNEVWFFTGKASDFGGI